MTKHDWKFTARSQKSPDFEIGKSSEPNLQFGFQNVSFRWSILDLSQNFRQWSESWRRHLKINVFEDGHRSFVGIAKKKGTYCRGGKKIGLYYTVQLSSAEFSYQTLGLWMTVSSRYHLRQLCFGTLYQALHIAPLTLWCQKWQQKTSATTPHRQGQNCGLACT